MGLHLNGEDIFIYFFIFLNTQLYTCGGSPV